MGIDSQVVGGINLALTRIGIPNWESLVHI
jgi:hypothetical protein